MSCEFDQTLFGFDPDWMQQMENEYSEYTYTTSEESSDPEPQVVTSEDHCATVTTLSNLTAVVKTRTNYDGEGQLGSYLKQYPGLIILPIHAVTFIRKPTGSHRSDPPAIVYVHSDVESDSYPNLEAMLNYLHSNQ